MKIHIQNGCKMKYFVIFTFLRLSFCLKDNSSEIHNDLFRHYHTEINCEEYPILKYFDVTTNLNELSDDFNFFIIQNCEVDPKWKVREHSTKQCDLHNRVYETEDSNRRPFRFSFHHNPISKEMQITIKSILLFYPEEMAEATITKWGFTLEPGDYIDTYVDYDCLDLTEEKTPSNWFKMKIEIEMDPGGKISFEYIKICDNFYAEAFDPSYMLMIVTIFLTIYTSGFGIFKSKLEFVILKRFHEIKTAENLTIIYIGIGFVLIFLTELDILDKWIYVALFIVGPFSVAMISEGFLSKTSLMAKLESRTLEFTYMGSVSFYFIFCLGIGYALLVIWHLTQDWILSNILSLSISIITIRLFKANSFAFILFISFLAVIYELYWLIFKSQFYSEHFRLTNQVHQSLPIRVFCPELVTSPYYACYSMSIADIILPGVLLAYFRRFDGKKETRRKIYYILGICAVAMGLVITVWFFYVVFLPLPSFLFTGPFIHLTTLGFAWFQNDLKRLMKGFTWNDYEIVGKKPRLTSEEIDRMNEMLENPALNHSLNELELIQRKLSSENNY